MSKFTVIAEKGKDWEYRCHQCSQLRFCSGEEKPIQCGNCESTDIVIGRLGTLPTEEEA